MLTAALEQLAVPEDTIERQTDAVRAALYAGAGEATLGGG